MADASTRARGRPQGSGINDRAALTAINKLRRKYPDMPPTTAIKRAGIENPSTIRRLRDKLRAEEVKNAKRDPKPALKSPPKPIQPVPPAASRKAAALSTVQPARRGAVASPVAATSPEQDPRILAAFMQAFLQTPAGPPATMALPKTSVSAADLPPATAPTPPPAAAMQPRQEPPKPSPKPAVGGWPSWPGMPMSTPNMPGIPPMPFSMPMPLMPPFGPQLGSAFTGMSGILPLLPKPTAPQPSDPNTASTARQMDAMKLAVEAMTAIAKLQLHVVENAMAYSPFAAMLQGQTMIGQMMLAAFTGQMGANQKKPE